MRNTCLQWLKSTATRLVESRASSRVFTCRACRAQRRWHTSLSQRPGSDSVQFPGALKSKFSTKLEFTTAETSQAMPTYRFLDQDGKVVDQTKGAPDLSDEEAAKLYSDMVLVSIMDIIMFDAQRQGKISFYVVNAGEEGIGVGSASALNPRDPIFAQYREAGVLRYRGFEPADFLAQLFSTKHDTGKGRNMPVHYGSEKHYIHTISSPLATQIPQAAGAAYAVKMQNMQTPAGEQRVVVCYFGEGAASEGDFHAGLNIAATKQCPIVFICRNNGYSISTPTLEQYRGDGIASRGIGYGIDTIRVDGNDLLAVREVVKQARELALRDGGRPILIEAMSYRVSHHSTSDDSFAYRAKVEVEDWKRRDHPVTRFRKWMEGKGIWDEKKEAELRSQARKSVLDAYKKAEKDKHPPLKEMFTDVYAEMTEEQLEQLAKLKEIVTRYPNEYDLTKHEGGLKGLEV